MKLINNLHFIIASIFFILFSTLSTVRHLSFDSFGFDLGIVDQTIWHYSRFEAPITTIQFYVFTSKLTDHVELIYILLAPIYWLWSNPIILIIVEVLSVCVGSLAIFFLAKKLNLKTSVALATQITFLMFYGTQHAIWFDIHNVGFATGFLAWFLFALHTRNKNLAMFTLFIVLGAKENLGLLTGSIAFTYFLIYKYKETLIYLLVSMLYLLVIFGWYFPQANQDGYRYQNEQTINLSPAKLFDSTDKQKVWWFTLLSGIGLPLFYPLTLIPIVTDLATYFVLADHIKGTHGLFMHYRITLAPLLCWSLIMTIHKYPKLNYRYTALILCFSTLVLQYYLHLPLSYLSKPYFWQQLSDRFYIHQSLTQIPPSTSIVTQNNLVPHLSQRSEIFVLWPDTNYKDSNGIAQPWLRWSGRPQYLIVNTNLSWDIRHLLMEPQFLKSALTNMQTSGDISLQTSNFDTLIYRINIQPLDTKH